MCGGCTTGTDLATLVVEDSRHADRHELGTSPAQRSPPQSKDKGHVLLLTHVEDVVQSLVQTPCTQSASFLI